VYGVTFSKGSLWWSRSSDKSCNNASKILRYENKLHKKLEEKERMKMVMMKQVKK
jgi:hypothetical protein